MKRCSMRIVSIVWSVLALSVSIPVLLSAQSRWEVEIEQAETPPAIDADLGDWDGVRWHLFAPGAPHVVDLLADDGPTEPPGTAGTAADLSGHFALQWDDEWIYLGVAPPVRGADRGLHVPGNRP